jgi:hypothetical protein
VHLTLSITILPWRASLISGLLLTFCILPVAAWLIIKRTAAASAKMGPVEMGELEG